MKAGYFLLFGLIFFLIGGWIVPSGILAWIGILLAIIGLIILFSNLGQEYPSTKTQRPAERQNVNNDDTHGRDPVLHYEVTKGHFGNSQKQSLTYSGKKTRWR
jgi:membrane protein implicated in regulation of membrane protease activity